ncbi:hypothetical protein FNV43_RR23830 [Rhamnella rubrinervis]|uniref:Uncharacterized protein n=1 Tax=Rhamnella rubrinervis TaxID=2594499 RepID=A0A8K0DPG1_9ROSA|nr:hypothetical protein FNV43_RR23830 [Rhamnella rubrinervis]
MAKNDTKVMNINISPSPFEIKKENEIKVIDITSSSSEDDATPISHVLCLKREADVKLFEETEDCFILDFDSPKPTVSPAPDFVDGDPDIAVVSVKGQVVVPCRDYPHSRHLCMKFPFETTSHQSCCELCYCYVCDSAAPCHFWYYPSPAHCHASADNGDWDSKRNMRKKLSVIL